MSKISALPIAGDLTGFETIPLVQGGATKRIPLDLLGNPDVDAVVALANARTREALGIGETSSDMGDFEGSIIPTNPTIKQALQALELAIGHALPGGYPITTPYNLEPAMAGQTSYAIPFPVAIEPIVYLDGVRLMPIDYAIDDGEIIFAAPLHEGQQPVLVPNEVALEVGYAYNATYPERTAGRKLQRMADIYDFGAVGNNEVDDIAAFILASAWCSARQIPLTISEGAFVLSRKWVIPGTFEIFCANTAALRFTDPSDCGVLLDYEGNADTLCTIRLPQLFSSAINSNFEIPGYAIEGNGDYNLNSRVGNAVHLKGGNRLRVEIFHPVGWHSAFQVESTPDAVVANVDLIANTIDFCVKGITTYASQPGSAGVVALTFTANTVWAKYPVYIDGTNQSLAASRFSITGQSFSNELDGASVYGQNVAGKVDTCTFDLNWNSAGYQPDSPQGTPIDLINPFLAGSAASNGVTTDGNATIGYWAASHNKFHFGAVMGLGGGGPSGSAIPAAGDTIRIRDAGGYNEIAITYSDTVATMPIPLSSTIGETNYNGGLGAAQYSKKILCSASLVALANGGKATFYLYHQLISRATAKQIRITPVDETMMDHGISGVAFVDAATNNRQIKVIFRNNSGGPVTATVNFWVEIA